MRKDEFRNWLIDHGYAKKTAGDFCSRIARVCREMGDLDAAYNEDRCEFILSCFEHRGINPNMELFDQINLPIGAYSLATYKYAVKKYIEFLDEQY